MYFSKRESKWIGYASGWALAGFVSAITLNPFVAAGSAALASLNGDYTDYVVERGYCLKVRFMAWNPRHPDMSYERHRWCR